MLADKLILFFPPYHFAFSVKPEVVQFPATHFLESKRNQRQDYSIAVTFINLDFTFGKVCGYPTTFTDKAEFIENFGSSFFLYARILCNIVRREAFGASGGMNIIKNGQSIFIRQEFEYPNNLCLLGSFIHAKSALLRSIITATFTFSELATNSKNSWSEMFDL